MHFDLKNCCSGFRFDIWAIIMSFEAKVSIQNATMTIYNRIFDRFNGENVLILSVPAEANK